MVALLNTPSPTGYCHEAITLTEAAIADLGMPGVEMRRNNKDALIVTVPGQANDAPRAVSETTSTRSAPWSVR